MANLNKVMLIGRLTRDPEKIEIRGAVQGAKFGFAVNNRKLNQDTQQWEEVPVFIDMEIWNRGENSRQADRVLATLRKGQQVFIEGHLKLDTWTDSPEKGGAKRSKLTVVVEVFQYLEPRADGNGGEGGGSMPARSQPARSSPAPQRSAAPSYAPSASNYDEEDEGSSRGGRGAPENEDDIPF
jgi:single-strand DNA-binding protein